MGQPPDRPERADAFHGLVANFYSHNTKNSPAGRLVFGEWLEHYRVPGWAFLPDLGSGSLLVVIKGAFDSDYSGAHAASIVTLILGSASVALGQDLTPVALGQDSTQTSVLCISHLVPNLILTIIL